MIHSIELPALLVSFLASEHIRFSKILWQASPYMDSIFSGEHTMCGWPCCTKRMGTYELHLTINWCHLNLVTVMKFTNPPN